MSAKRYIILLWLTIICFSYTVPVSAQHGKKSKKSPIPKEIEKINHLLAYYDTLSPFSENDNRFDIIDSVQTQITNRLLELLNDKNVVNYDLDHLLKQEELSISHSKNRKVWFFSIDEKTGGSYRTSITIIHYRRPDGSVKAELFDGSQGEEEQDIPYATATYSDPFLLDSAEGKYFVLGGVQVCNTCQVVFAYVLQLDSDAYTTTLIDLYDGRTGDLRSFDFDTSSRALNVDYFAAPADDTLYGREDVYPGRQLHTVSKWEYINGSYLETEHCERWENQKE